MIRNLILAFVLGTTVFASGCSMAQKEGDDQRFLSLAASLQSYTAATRQFNFEREDLILRNIYDQMLRGDQRNTLLKNDMDENKKRAGEIFDLLAAAKKRLREIGEADQVTNEWGNPGEHSATEQLFLGTSPDANDSRGNGQAYEIHEKIKGYVQWANDLVLKLNREMSSPIKKDQIEVPIQDHAQPAQTWEQRSFQGASTAAAYAELSRLEMDVALVEGELLDYLHVLTRSNWATEVNLLVLESVEDRTVNPGEDFVAQFRLGDIHGLYPEYITDGKVEMNPDGSATVRWKAQPSQEVNEKGLGVQPYQLEVKVPTATGASRSIKHQGEFYIKQ